MNYAARAPLLEIPAYQQDISDHGQPSSPMFPLTGPQEWRKQRTELRQQRYDENGLHRKEYVGGYFTGIGGEPRNLFARLSNDTAALQNATCQILAQPREKNRQLQDSESNMERILALYQEIAGLESRKQDGGIKLDSPRSGPFTLLGDFLNVPLAIPPETPSYAPCNILENFLSVLQIDFGLVILALFEQFKSDPMEVVPPLF